MNEIKSSDWTAILQSVAQVMTDNADHLCEMDARMGDGDLGPDHEEGLLRPARNLFGLEEADMGKRLSKSGMKMSSVVPSTMGTLMSSGIMAGGKALKGKPELDAAGLAAYIAAFADGIQQRGKCQRGNRTILDALAAAADKASALVSAHPESSLQDVINAAVEGAGEGVEATKSMTPVFGKAAVFAAKAIGTPDQGAVAGRYMLIGMQNYILPVACASPFYLK